MNGNVECEQFECNGYGAVTGDLKVAVHELADLVKSMAQFMLKRCELMGKQQLRKM